MTFSTTSRPGTRRRFLRHLGAAATGPLLAACRRADSREAALSTTARTLRHPIPIGSPVLESIRPVIERSIHVRTNVDTIVEHAEWLAYEELPFPVLGLPPEVQTDLPRAIDFAMVTNTINTAFTDFATGQTFRLEVGGQVFSDSDAMTTCFRRALAEQVPVLDGRYLASLTREQLTHLFRGSNIAMPMLDEKLQALRNVAAALVHRYGGFFHNFVATCSRRLYDDGNGLVERLVREFPRFDDVSRSGDAVVRFYKLAQLGYWSLHTSLKAGVGFPIADIGAMTAFADYIVPVALRVMRVLVYTPALDEAIAAGREIPRDSAEEIEIRAHMLHATALLCEEINKRRPPELQIVIPQLDARLWLSYHATHWPHHLTRTIMY